MKKVAFVLLGLFLVAMALAAITSAAKHHGDPIELLIAAAFGFGAWRSFRAVRRLTPRPEPKPRPWEH